MEEATVVTFYKTFPICLPFHQKRSSSNEIATVKGTVINCIEAFCRTVFHRILKKAEVYEKQIKE